MNENARRWQHCLDLAAMSDVGLTRSNNQDSMAVELAENQTAYDQRGHLFIVADGMGAHAAGEVASKLAVDTVPVSYQKAWNRAPHEALFAAIRDANSQIYRQGQSNKAFGGMGTTLSVLAILPQGAVVAHVGDSRVYRARNGILQQLTFDHSLVWEVCAAEGIPESEAPGYIPKNVITRSVGPHSEVQADVEGPFPVEIGDSFLLCSDGLSGLVLDKEVGTILHCLPPNEAMQTMVDLAILRGGPDNITGIVVRVTEEQIAAKDDDDPDDAVQRPKYPVHPALWVLLGVCLAASVGAAVLQQWLVAAAGLVGALVTGSVALAGCRRKPKLEDGPVEKLYGKGPYTELDCTPDAEFVTYLDGLLKELHDTAVSRNWTVDWTRVDQFKARAVTASEGADFTGAIRQQCLAISFITSQLRGQPAQEKPGADGS